ncbi:hypothetical protein TRICI_002868 [Trichomonascus ciferrii]|uniref:Uncharacterized protein n=1 Tax=Trichomonascus ciferrii TaxID=44093 RepID=A0A642VAL6_9ASCO|nr:hypothetical protein TRICI_002868 [Trichomonascus ciferrii]
MFTHRMNSHYQEHSKDPKKSTTVTTLETSSLQSLPIKQHKSLKKRLKKLVTPNPNNYLVTDPVLYYKH